MLVAFTGYKGVGKDTAADYLSLNYGFRRIAFADKLKEAVANLFGVTVQEVDKWKYEEPALKGTGAKPLGFVEVHLDIGGDVEYTYTWRELLQRFGTEMGRNTFGEDFWVDLVSRQINDDDDDIAISDVRFDNEARMVHLNNGYLIEITRPEYASDGHASEAGVSDEYIDCLITNSGTLQEFYDDLDGLMEDIKSGNYAE